MTLLMSDCTPSKVIITIRKVKERKRTRIKGKSQGKREGKERRRIRTRIRIRIIRGIVCKRKPLPEPSRKNFGIICFFGKRLFKY